MEEKITQALNSWLERNGFEVRVLGEADDFCWWNMTNDIEYSVNATEKHLNFWAELLDELGLNYDIDPFYTSFLHEVGHSMTYDEFEEEEIEEYFDIVELMREDPGSFGDDTAYVYFRLPLELTATEWMVDFINKNAEVVCELVNAVRPLLISYLEKRISI